MRPDTLAANLTALATRAQELEGTWKNSRTAGGWFDDKAAYEALITEALSTAEHIYGKRHAHHQRIVYWYNKHSLDDLRAVRGILEGIAANIENGFLTTLTTKVAIDISTDFLATAAAFVEAGDKDPAAVLSCCVLEDSVKRLAKKFGNEAAKDQEFSVVVNSLLAQKVIEKSTHSTLQSFRGLRNAAFHASGMRSLWSPSDVADVCTPVLGAPRSGGLAPRPSGAPMAFSVLAKVGIGIRSR